MKHHQFQMLSERVMNLRGRTNKHDIDKNRQISLTKLKNCIFSKNMKGCTYVKGNSLLI